MKFSRHSAAATPVLVAVLTLGATACNGVQGVEQKQSAAPSTPETTAPASSSPASATPEATGAQETGGPAVAQSQAARSAQNSVDGGRVTSVELKSDRKAWKVDVMTGEPRVHHITVDAATGALLGSTADRMPDHARKRLNIPLGLLDEATIDRDQAASKALEKVGKGFVDALSIQGRPDSPRWEVGVRDSRTLHEIGIDARSGRVVESRTHEAPAVDPSSAPRESATQSSGTPERTEQTQDGRDRVRERSHDYGRDHYDWGQHVPR